MHREAYRNYNADDTVEIVCDCGLVILANDDVEADYLLRDHIDEEEYFG